MNTTNQENVPDVILGSQDEYSTITIEGKMPAELLRHFEHARFSPGDAGHAVQTLVHVVQCASRGDAVIEVWLTEQFSRVMVKILEERKADLQRKADGEPQAQTVRHDYV